MKRNGWLLEASYGSRLVRSSRRSLWAISSHVASFPTTEKLIRDKTFSKSFQNTQKLSKKFTCSICRICPLNQPLLPSKQSINIICTPWNLPQKVASSYEWNVFNIIEVFKTTTLSNTRISREIVSILRIPSWRTQKSCICLPLTSPSLSLTNAKWSSWFAAATQRRPLVCRHRGGQCFTVAVL